MWYHELCGFYLKPMMLRRVKVIALHQPLRWCNYSYHLKGKTLWHFLDFHNQCKHIFKVQAFFQKDQRLFFKFSMHNDETSPFVLQKSVHISTCIRIMCISYIKCSACKFAAMHVCWSLILLVVKEVLDARVFACMYVCHMWYKVQR